MEISVAFAPAPETPEHVRLAEELGYRRAWCYDSPALYPDVWMTIALAAERTSRIGLGPAVLIPSLRHPVAQAAAIATTVGLAPGRVEVAVGSGFTGRRAMGQKPLRWDDVETYIRQVRALLAGEAVEVEGKLAQLIPAPPACMPAFPIAVPMLVGAGGPKGYDVARRLGLGVVLSGRPVSGFPRCALLTFGTVLDEGEEPTSPRVLEAAGGGHSVAYHALYERDPASVARLPNGAAWRAMIEREPEATRHLRIHEMHLAGVSERDGPFLDPATVARTTFTGTVAELRERMAQLEAQGATEILYQPMGPDIPRELRTFAQLIER